MLDVSQLVGAVVQSRGAALQECSRWASDIFQDYVPSLCWVFAACDKRASHGLAEIVHNAAMLGGADELINAPALPFILGMDTLLGEFAVRPCRGCGRTAVSRGGSGGDESGRGLTR